MGKAQDQLNEFLSTVPGKIDAINQAESDAKTKADEAQSKAYLDAYKTYSDAIKAIEEESIRLQEAAAAEAELEILITAITLKRHKNE